jgi:hypothetical protein
VGRDECHCGDTTAYGVSSSLALALDSKGPAHIRSSLIRALLAKPIQNT